MGEFNLLNLTIGFIITWGVGLVPPLIIRYTILKRPMQNGPAIGTCAVLWLFNLIFFAAIGSENKFHSVLYLVAVVSFFILRKETSNILSQKEVEESGHYLGGEKVIPKIEISKINIALLVGCIFLVSSLYFLDIKSNDHDDRQYRQQIEQVGVSQHTNQPATSNYAKELVLALESTEKSNWHAQGNAYYNSGQYTKAIEAYQQAIRLYPEDSDVLYNLGVVYYQTGQFSKAIESYRGAVRVSPQDAEAWYSLGNAFTQIGLQAKAMEAYERAVNINHGKGEATLALPTGRAIR